MVAVGLKTMTGIKHQPTAVPLADFVPSEVALRSLT